MLTIAVLSDIHSNYVALEKCLDYAINAGADSFFFLGDYVSDFAYPQKTMDILYALKEKYRCFFIKGNRDDYMINFEKGQKGWKEYGSTIGTLYYTYQNLRQRDLQFFKSLSLKEELEFDGLPSLTVCHGSPRKVNEKLLPGVENTFSIMDNDPNDYILCGHTHIQGKIEHNGKTVLNPGSVGVPMHSNGKAQFMILRGAQGVWSHKFISLEYDIETAIADLYSSGLYKKAPYWCKVLEKSVKTGEIEHGVVLERAMDICKEKLGECRWPDIPEECWAQAVREMLPDENT